MYPLSFPRKSKHLDYSFSSLQIGSECPQETKLVINFTLKIGHSDTLLNCFVSYSPWTVKEYYGTFCPQVRTFSKLRFLFYFALNLISYKGSCIISRIMHVKSQRKRGTTTITTTTPVPTISVRFGDRPFLTSFTPFHFGTFSKL